MIKDLYINVKYNIILIIKNSKKLLIRVLDELFDSRYLFLDGVYNLKKWKINCEKKIKYKRLNIK